MFKIKLFKCITTKSKFCVHMSRWSTKGLLFGYIIKVKNGPSVLNTWHPHLVDKPRKLCVHYTSSPALNRVADWAWVSWEHTFLFGEVRETSERCVGCGLLVARHGSVLKQSRWKWWNGTMCQLSQASASSTKTVSVVTQLIPITVPERESWGQSASYHQSSTSRRWARCCQ